MAKKAPGNIASPTPTLERIVGAAPPEMLERGEALYVMGNVTSAKTDGNLITARVVDQTNLYRTYVRMGDADDYGFCTCKPGHPGVCAHTIAAMMHLRDNWRGLRADERMRGGHGRLIRLVPLKDLQGFVESEMKKDSGVERRFVSRFGGLDDASQVDYREQVDAMFSDVYYMSSRKRLSFADFFRAAKDRERRGQAPEAIRILAEVSEAIKSNYYMVDDSSGHYANAFIRAVSEMAACISRQKMRHSAKRPYIDYLHRQFLANDPEVDEEAYGQALTEVCTERQDLEHLRRLNGRALPKEAISEDIKGYFQELDRVILQADVLEKIGEIADAANLFEKHYRSSIDACGAYVEMLMRQGERAKARGIMEEARGIFSEYDFQCISDLVGGAAE